MGWLKTGLTAVGSLWGPAGAAVGNTVGGWIDSDGGGGGGGGSSGAGNPGKFGFGNAENYQYGSSPGDADYGVARTRAAGDYAAAAGIAGNRDQQIIGNSAAAAGGAAAQAGNQAWWNQAAIGRNASQTGVQAYQNQANVGNRSAAVGENTRYASLAEAKGAQYRAPSQGDFADQDRALMYSGSYGNQLAGLNQAQAARSAEGQAQQLAGLEAQQGPSAAQAQLQSASNQAIGTQLALARSGRGFGGNAASQGLAQGNIAALNANAANQSSQLRAQEDAAWRQRQASNLNAAGGLNLNVNQQRAQNLQGAAGNQLAIGQQEGSQAAANLGAAQQQRTLNDQYSMGLQKLGTDAFFQGQQQQGTAYQTGAAQALQGMAQQSQAEQIGAGLQLQGFGTQLQGINQQGQAYAQGVNQIQQGQNIALGGEGVANNIRSTEQQGKLAEEDNALRAWAAENNYNIGIRNAEAQEQAAQLAFVSSLAGSGATYGAAGGSDIRGKRNIEIDPAAGSEFARSLGVPERAQYDRDALDAAAKAEGSFYDYKNPSAPGADDKRHYGPMAQDLAKTPAGATAVTKMPDGKLGVDYGRLSLVNTSAISAQQRQIDEQQRQLEEIERQTAQFQAQPGAQYPLYSYGSFPDEAGYY